MLRVIFTHLYVIVMAIIVITTSHILANRYGDDIVNGLKNLVTSADSGMNEMQENVKDWNKNMLD
jgi:C4-dicarboxylate transporter